MVYKIGHWYWVRWLDHYTPSSNSQWKWTVDSKEIYDLAVETIGVCLQQDDRYLKLGFNYAVDQTKKSQENPNDLHYSQAQVILKNEIIEYSEVKIK